ncbi:MAG: proline racemase family protein [Mycobacteriales bacterium]
MTALGPVTTVDYHTAGEPFRIVTGGAAPLEGNSVAARRVWAAAHLDDVRQLLVNEPRGHAGMYGGFVTEPDDAGADVGVVFFHKDGYSTACGHGTIALGRWAIDSGLVVAPHDGEATVVIDVPSGRVEARVRMQAGSATGIAFANVPSYAVATGLRVVTSLGPIDVDLAYGGAFYASVRAAELALEIAPESAARLVAIGREIKWALNDHPAVSHPDDERLSGVYGTILYDELDRHDGSLHHRNVTIFADGALDRSPCGSGSSARMALLAESGELAPGDTFVHDSIVGTRFVCRLGAGTTGNAGVTWATEVEGTAYRTGEHSFAIEDGDDVGTGFQLG